MELLLPIRTVGGQPAKNKGEATTAIAFVVVVSPLTLVTRPTGGRCLATSPVLTIGRLGRGRVYPQSANRLLPTVMQSINVGVTRQRRRTGTPLRGSKS